MAEQSRHGYLVLADISGYTSFLAKVELEHAHEILTDLLEAIVEKFKALLTISKLEGDAVFAYVDETSVPRGETILELVENTYLAFRQRRDSSKRMTTCTCKACQSMPSLELKFFVHHGDFMVQNISGIKELVGSDVNLVHRLMKNHITENTGWKAYVMFTKTAMTCMQLELEDVHNQVENYEHLGDIDTATIDLIPRYDVLAAERRYYLTEEESHISISHEHQISDAELWQILASTDALNKFTNVTWSVGKRTKGRTGIGSQNHCAHGRGVLHLTFVDWHPFSYMTGYGIDGKMRFYQMYEIQPIDDGSRSILIFRWKMETKMPHWLVSFITSIMFKKTGAEFNQGLEDYIKNIQQPSFQPEAA